MKKLRSFTEVFSDLISNEFSLNLYFGKIVHKITEHRYSLNILNPIILTKLPSLYKFKIKGNDNLIKNQYTTYISDIKEPISITYIHFPNKIYDVMIYQYRGTKSKTCNSFTVGKDKEFVLEVGDKKVDDILQLLTGLCEDVHYKLNKKE
ncbi:hypothetical protein AAJ76_3700030603 [Vairimorpha ceranae]|uniref:Uncharacterized protein n=1 Tax=Vairimorpha ceranae TaxID=40302 RepID=A0A0F9YQZ1_9MICR|nr:hypothetical protein AAJ76_3700030603 [Vairimorpha ceranae]KAF5140774.1 hypothetical protein G9O61_00g010940 [Vairimorpha ceranae]KKO74977.1 hypothetical protein AAJ76_3700030603 [Vairimorpha ceranae]